MNEQIDEVQISSVHAVSDHSSATEISVPVQNPEIEINGSVKAKESGSATKEKSKNIKRKREVDATATTEKTKKPKKSKNDIPENSKKKTATHPPISEMVQQSIKNLKKRSGASSQEISKYVEDNYQVNINRINPYIKKFLQKGVNDGLIDLVSSSGTDGKYKIKKAEKAAKGAGNPPKKATGKTSKEKTAKATKEIGKIKKVAEKAKANVKLGLAKKMATQSNAK